MYCLPFRMYGQIFQAYKDRVEEVKSRGKELGEEAERDQLGALQVWLRITMLNRPSYDVFVPLVWLPHYWN